MNKIQALHSFWSGFGLKAYDENSVPENAELPYITYEVASDDFDNQLLLTASLWYRESSWKNIQEKALQIESYIGKGGQRIDYDNGCMWIWRANPFSQRAGDSNDDLIRRIIINITVEFID